MNKLGFAVLGGSLLLGAATTEAADISGNVSLATDYVYRGYSQTNEQPTIQGGFDVAGESGLYGGVWASNVEFGDGVPLEVDIYVGYGGDLTDDVSFDIGFIHYDYPDQPSGTPDSNFEEIYGSLGYEGLTVGFAYSNDFYAETGTGTYLYVDYELSLPNDFGLAFHYGMTDVDDINWDYADYSIGLSKAVADLDVSLTWFDTDDNCMDLCDSRVVLGVSKSL